MFAILEHHPQDHVGQKKLVDRTPPSPGVTKPLLASGLGFFIDFCSPFFMVRATLNIQSWDQRAKKHVISLAKGSVVVEEVRRRSREVMCLLQW